jgi:hypothetical protein
LRERAAEHVGISLLRDRSRSPPMMLGTSARFVSVMLTRIEPEKTGPMTM